MKSNTIVEVAPGAFEVACYSESSIAPFWNWQQGQLGGCHIEEEECVAHGEACPHAAWPTAGEVQRT